jgi:hypothetical protein
MTAKAKRRIKEQVTERMFARIDRVCEQEGVPLLAATVDPVTRHYEIVFKCKEWFDTVLEGPSPRALARKAMRYVRGEA